MRGFNCETVPLKQKRGKNQSKLALGMQVNK